MKKVVVLVGLLGMVLSLGGCAKIEDTYKPLYQAIPEKSSTKGNH